MSLELEKLRHVAYVARVRFWTTEPALSRLTRQWLAEPVDELT